MKRLALAALLLTTGACTRYHFQSPWQTEAEVNELKRQNRELQLKVNKCRATSNSKGWRR